LVSEQSRQHNPFSVLQWCGQFSVKKKNKSRQHKMLEFDSCSG